MHKQIIAGNLCMHVHTVQSNNRLTFDKGLELLMLHLPRLHINFEGEEQSEEELVAFVQTTSSVFEHSKREILNDVVDPLLRHWRLIRPEKYRTHNMFTIILRLAVHQNITYYVV